MSSDNPIEYRRRPEGGWHVFVLPPPDLAGTPAQQIGHLERAGDARSPWLARRLDGSELPGEFKKRDEGARALAVDRLDGMARQEQQRRQAALRRIAKADRKALVARTRPPGKHRQKQWAKVKRLLGPDDNDVLLRASDRLGRPIDEVATVYLKEGGAAVAELLREKQEADVERAREDAEARAEAAKSWRAELDLFDYLRTGRAPSAA